MFKSSRSDARVMYLNLVRTQHGSPPEHLYPRRPDPARGPLPLMDKGSRIAWICHVVTEAGEDLAEPQNISVDIDADLRRTRAHPRRAAIAHSFAPTAWRRYPGRNRRRPPPGGSAVSSPVMASVEIPPTATRQKSGSSWL